MDDLEARINARLVELIGPGNVAVIDGPLADPMVIEARPLFEDSHLRWALERYHAHARNLASGNPDGERARRPVAIVYVGPDEQSHVIVEPTAARDVEGPSRTLRRMPLLQPHHIRHRHQRIGSFAVLDFPSSRKTLTLFMPGSDRLGARFANKSYRYTFDGVGFARGGQYLSVDGERVPVRDYDEQRAAAMQVQREAPVVLRYSYDQGLTLGGNTKFYKDRIARVSGRTRVMGADDQATSVAFRFKWSPKQRIWYVPRSRYTAWSRAAVDEVAEALRSEEVPVELVYESPRDAGIQTLPEPKPRAPVPTPPGWPPIPLDDALAKLRPEAQLETIPRYSADDYRWHTIQLDRLVTTIEGLATNILGHRVVAHPPGAMVPFWVLVVDGERWGRGEEDFFVLANNFHRELVPTLEPVPVTVPRRVNVTDGDIANARARVAQRKARSRALDDVARAAGIEVCPRAIFEIHPLPEGREQIKARAEAFSDLVHRYRELHEIELWAAGKLVHFPHTEARRLNNNFSPPTFLGDRKLAHAAVEWARERYDSWLETVIDVMKPRDRANATRVLDFCVRDVASGRRRAREGRPHARPAEALDLLAYQAPEPTAEERPRVVPPASASKPREAAAKPAARSAKLERLAAAWSEHVASRPKRPWTNVPSTSCFVRNEKGVDVTLCPTPQTKPVEHCPPLVTSIADKSRRVMLCDADTVLYFGSIGDAQVEAANMAVRKRVSRAAEPSDDWPAADDFTAQERFLDALVPARLVFDRDRPFSLWPVEVAPPRVVAGAESFGIDKARDQPVHDDAVFEPQVAVGKTRVTGLREFVDALGDELFVYRGQAAQETIDGLLSRLSHAQRVALGRKKTANDIQHGVFAGRSLYWIGDGEQELVGPVLANGKLASGRAKDEVLERLAKAMPLPDALPFGWTLDDTIVIAALVRGELSWSVWNSTSQSFSSKRESEETWAQPRPMSNEPDAETGVSEYMTAAFDTLDRLLDHAPATIRFRVAGPWLGRVFPSDYGNRVVFDPPTGGAIDLELLERLRDRHQQLSVQFPHEEDHVGDFRRAKRRVEWARKWLREHAQEQPSRAAAKAPATVATQEEPKRSSETPKPKPTRAAKAKPSQADLAALAREHGAVPGERASLGHRGDLLYEAEKRGCGPKMRSWLVKHRLIKPEWATELGARARGRLAFERGEAWPPPPARGDAYSPKEYEGILDSVAYSPEAQAAKQLADHWTATIQQIPGAARFYRNYDLARSTLDRLRLHFYAQLDEEKTPEAARKRYEGVKAALEVLTRDMRTSLDPSLYDKSREPADVYPTLCEISNDIAKDVLETLYGIEFPERRDHYALCDGKSSLGDLDHKAKQHAEADAAQKRESNKVRLADGRALLAVAKDAAARGELTEKRFNLAYWRLYPKLESYRREEHRLRLTWFPGFRQARGVAPKGSGKFTDGFVRGPSGHGFSAKVYDADGEVAVVQAVIAAIRKEVAELEALLADTPSARAPASEPKRARKRSTAAAKAKPTEAQLAELARAGGVTPERGGTIGDRIAVLYEAEKRGWGPPMRRWMLDHRRLTPTTAASYSAEARGRLALERSEWPPAPTRGAAYSKAEYAGLLRSLRHSPEALATAEVAKQWTKALARIPNGHVYFHDANLAARANVQTILYNTARFDGVRTPESALACYGTLKEKLSDLSERMRLSMDPSLFDGSRDARDVYATLCKIDNDVARYVLRGVYDLSFADGADHFRLCDGALTFDEFERSSNARDREAATRKLESKRDEIADARALLTVADQTRSTGEFTERRFNNTYWRLHPTLPRYRRARLRLTLKWSPGFERDKPGIAPPQTDKPTTAQVFGPNGYGFHVRAQGKTQAEVIEVLVDEIRRRLGETERELASLERPLAETAPTQPEPSMTESEEPQDEAYTRELERVDAANAQRRLADAQALLSVATITRERGELTAANFNRIYWQTQKIPKYQRKDLRLQVATPKGSGTPSMTLALVVGPNSQGFHLPLPGEVSETDAIAALVEQIERELVELGGEKAPRPAAPRTRAKSRGRSHSPAAESPRSKPVTFNANKLRSLADSMETKANAELGVEREENTPRRAEMAKNLRDRARRQLVLAGTLRRIADAGEAGDYEHISRISNKADLEALEVELSRAGSARRKAEGVFAYWKPDDPTPRDVDHAVFGGMRTDRAGLRDLVEFTGKLPGLAGPHEVLEAAASRLGDDFASLRPEEVEAVRATLAALRKAKIPAKDVPRVVENFGESLREVDRFSKLGVVDTASLRTALREYMTCCRGHERKQQDDPIAAKKRVLAFAKIPGFFPTPRPLVERMVDMADLEPGMRVLEPSAGDGAIALVIRERHPDVELDVIERQVSLRELLEAQGFSLVADDFCAYAPTTPYDRILMNPPFEARQDVQHIGHALDLLAPGGRLVAIASAGLSFRDDVKTKALRDRVEQLGGHIEPLPSGSFEASGTGVNTVLVVVDKPRAATRPEPAQVAAPPQPRSEPMSKCSAQPSSPCRTKSKAQTSDKPKKSSTKAKLAAELAKQDKAEASPSKPARKAKSSSNAAKTPGKNKASKTKTTKKKTRKKKASKKKLPNWRYTVYRNDRYRFREVDNTFVVERQKDEQWIAASAPAAKAIHAKSESACALAAKILPRCGGDKPKAAKVRPSTAQKQAMREFLGL